MCGTFYTKRPYALCANGLPNPILFPQEKLLESMQRVVAERGAEAFQYSATAGIEGLRQWVADDVADDAQTGQRGRGMLSHWQRAQNGTTSPVPVVRFCVAGLRNA